MGDQEDIMLTFRQKIQLNNDEHMFFRQEVDSWRDEMQCQQDGPTSLEEISYIESSEDEEDDDPGARLLKKGNEFLEKGEWARAISTYTSAISKKRTARYYTKRALAYLKRNNLVEAEKDCTEAINLDPQFTKAFIRRALARKLLGKCKESSDDMEIIMKLDPNNEMVALEYEAMLDHLQDNLPCVEDSTVQRDKEETAMKLKQLGNDLVSKCEYRKATEKFTSAIKLNPKNPTFYANRAICHMKLKDFVSAEKDCSEALKLDGKYAKAYLRRARIRKCLGKLYESRQDFYSTFELTQDENVLEELEEAERCIRQIETQRRSKGEEITNRHVISILGKDNSGQPEIVMESDGIKMKSRQPLNDEETIQHTKKEPSSDRLPYNNFSACDSDSTFDQKSTDGTAKGTSKDIHSSISQNSLQQTNTTISIPASESASADDLSTKYDFREVFPLKRDDPSVKFTGPFIRVIIEDGKFAAPDKLLEVPDDIMRNLSPR